MTRISRQEIDDLHIAARAIRGSSWPGDMAEEMEQRAARIERLAERLNAQYGWRSPDGSPEPAPVTVIYDSGGFELTADEKLAVIEAAAAAYEDAAGR